MTTADDLARAKASVHDPQPIPVRRYGQVPPPSRRVQAQFAQRPSRLRSALATGGWLLLMALAIGMVVRFGH